jgi:hypothetical protein
MHDDGELLVSPDGPTLLDPRTHGAFIPQLSGKAGSVTLSNGGRAVNWQAEINSSGPISLWGRAIIQLSNDAPFNQIDKILKKFVDENPSVFGVSSRDLLNDKNRTKYSGPFKYITYQRYFRIESEPYLVQGAYITFRFKNNLLTQITNNSYGDIGIVEAPVVNKEDAIRAVEEDAHFDEEKDRMSNVSPQLQTFFGIDHKIHFRVVYQMKVRKSFPKGAFDYSVSALDGHVVRIMSSLHTSQALGEVYLRYNLKNL